MIFNQSEFADFCHCTRQNVSKYVRKGEIIKNSDDKIDTDDPINKVWIEQRFINDSISSAKEEAYNGHPDISKNVAKNSNKKNVKNDNEKEFSTQEYRENSIPDDFYKSVKPFSAKKPKDFDGMTFAQRKVFYEMAKTEQQYEKLRLENKKERCEVVERETLGNTCFGYLAALNKLILALPISYVDEFGAAYKKGKSKTELTDILRKPITQAIIDAREQMKKEINRYVKEMKYEKPEKTEDDQNEQQ